MICRTLRPRSAWSCEINMFWDTDQAIMSTTRAGAKSRSSCAHPRAFRLFPFTPRPATTRRRTEVRHNPHHAFLAGLALLLALLLFAGPSFAQILCRRSLLLRPRPGYRQGPNGQPHQAKCQPGRAPYHRPRRPRQVRGRTHARQFPRLRRQNRAEALSLQARRYSRQHGPGHRQ